MSGAGGVPAGVRRLCLAVDVERYSARDTLGQLQVQRRLVETLDHACARVSGLNRLEWLRQAQGDGELALLPPGLDESWVVPELLRELRVELGRLNRDLNDASRVRLRLALHEGVVHEGANGYAGDAVVVVSRLCDCAELRAALARNPDSDLVVIVSDRLYADVVSQGFRDLRPETFRRVLISNPAKRFTAEAWVHVADPVAGARARTAPPPDPYPRDGDPRVDGRAWGGPPVSPGGMIV